MATWIDGAVRGEARRRAEAIVASDVERHASEAARAERDAAERQRAQIAGERETRDQRIAAMSPTDVAQASQAAKAAKEAAEMLRSRRIVSVLDDDLDVDYGYTHHDPGGPSLGFGR